MGTGAQQAEQWRDAIAEGEAEWADEDAPAAAGEAAFSDDDDPAVEPPSAPSFWRETLPAVLLALIGVAWIAAASWAIVTTSPVRPDLLALIGWAGLASAPLALIGILYLLLRRTSRREARRFARSARAMAAQADYLERVLASISTRIDEHRMLLARHAEQLVDDGDRAASRLSEISGAIREDTTGLAHSSARLSGAASAARGDMDALMATLPDAAAQTREMTELLQEASRSAQEQAVTLADRLGALAAHGREADEAAGAAARSLADHLARIEETGATAERRMRETGAEMARMVDAALGQAVQAVDETRKGMEAQSAAMLAMIDQGRAALDHAGSSSARAIDQRLEQLGDKVESLASRLATQDAASQTLIANIDQALAEIELRFAALGETGAERTASLGEAIGALGTQVEQMGGALAGGGDAADALLRRVAALHKSLDASLGEISDALPAALERVEQQAARSHAAIAAALPEAEKLEATTRTADGILDQGDERIARHREAIEQLGHAAEQRIAAIRDQAETLHTLILEADQNSQRLVDGSGPKLIETLLRVREAAARGAEDARRTLESVIPEAADALGRASGDAMDRALIGRVEKQMAEIAVAAEQAVKTAGKASERLMRQMLTIADTSAAIEARISETRAESAASDEANFSRRVALLIESLNSTAIDVTKILSNEVTDTAWAAYLRGDRGIFTRRAVRLISSGEAREIARHYEREPEFREHVNRYIHDFEAMLRRILASRASAPLGVTMLSSDMGKLYVALAQAIERLRK